ncbi:MAG: calcium/sodium antiporter [Candidatus Spechtbacterales bacterium]
MYDTYLYIVVLALGIYFLVKSGTYIVRSLGVMARYLGVSDFVIAFLLMAFATSIPELAVGINAAFSNSPEIVLGNILGTNIVNLSLIMGLVAVIALKVSVDDHDHFLKRRFFNFTLIMSPLFLMLDGSLGRLDGLILLVLFSWNTARLFNVKETLQKRNGVSDLNTPEAEKDKKSVSLREFFKNFFMFSVSNFVILAAAYAVVWAAENISIDMGIPAALIGIFVIGIGTSLPELVFGISSASSGKGDMSLGNLLGSAVINATLILGITVLIKPITIEGGIFWISGIFLAATMLAGFYFLRTKDFLNRKEGIALVFLYILFIFVELGHNLWF